MWHKGGGGVVKKVKNKEWGGVEVLLSLFFVATQLSLNFAKTFYSFILLWLARLE